MRRQALTSALIIGIIGALATGSTMAVFNDLEVSEDNVFTAGELDLKIDYKHTYHGAEKETRSFDLMNEPKTFFDLDDVKPGDKANASISFHVYDNPAYISMKMNQTSNKENGCNEPEERVDDSCADPGKGLGELDEKVKMELWYDDGDGIRSGDEKDDDYTIAKGTAEEIMGEPIMLDGDLSNGETDPYEPSNTEYVGLKWKLPKKTGNKVQSDSFKFDVWFHAQQSRHNDNPPNPFEIGNDDDEE